MNTLDVRGTQPCLYNNSFDDRIRKDHRKFAILERAVGETRNL